MEKLEAVDVETLTPIEALNFLYELKKTLKGSLNGCPVLHKTHKGGNDHGSDPCSGQAHRRADRSR